MKKIIVILAVLAGCSFNSVLADNSNGVSGNPTTQDNGGLIGLPRPCGSC